MTDFKLSRRFADDGFMFLIVMFAVCNCKDSIHCIVTFFYGQLTDWVDGTIYALKMCVQKNRPVD